LRINFQLGASVVASAAAPSAEMSLRRDHEVPKGDVNPGAAPRSVAHAALGAPVRRTPARPRPP
jgi:hypothetical protein